MGKGVMGSDAIKEHVLANLSPREMIQLAEEFNGAVFESCLFAYPDWTHEAVAEMICAPIAWRVKLWNDEAAFWYRQFNFHRKEVKDEEASE